MRFLKKRPIRINNIAYYVHYNNVQRTRRKGKGGGTNRPTNVLLQ